ncbi:MAG: ATP-binding protein [Candidatus Peribacteria bacterium]|nr:ATP-binding protein [Candidatus Peribacteria bacterium]
MKIWMINEILHMQIVPREGYLYQIMQYRGAPLIKVLTGMRRVGKSYVLKHILQKAVIDYAIPLENILYVDKERIEFDSIMTYQDLYQFFQTFLKTIQSDKKIIIAIDEIQAIDQREKFINSALAQWREKAEIFITGSNSTMLSSELTTNLTGRYIEFEIFPLGFEEYSIFANHPRTKELFNEYVKYGGLPGIFSVKKTDEVIFPYLQGIYTTILLKDLIKYFGIRNVDFFEDLYKFLFANIGNIVSAKSISDYLKSQRIKLSPEMIITYLSYGTKVYMIDIVKSVNPDTKKYFEIFNKYYVGDLGLRNALVGYNFDKDI